MANHNPQEKNSLVGQTVGRLEVLERVPNPRANGPSPNAKWCVAYRCRCECGKELVVEKGNLKTGNTISCGCYHSEVTSLQNPNYKKSFPAEYRAWGAMRNRCNNPNNAEYARYGGRGLCVDPAWDDFLIFLMEIGPRPGAEYSVDRIDNSLGYQPGNVRWASKVEQCSNTRRNVYLTFNGRTETVSEWARITGITVYALNARLKRNWSVEKALTRPLDMSTQKKK